MKNRDDEQFESYLRQFRPLAPGPLPSQQLRLAVRRPLLFAGWAAAAAVLLVTATVLTMRLSSWRRQQAGGTAGVVRVEQTVNPPPLTIGAANALFAHAPSTQAVIDQMAFPSRAAQVSPLSKGTRSALAVLSEEKIKL